MSLGLISTTLTASGPQGGNAAELVLTYTRVRDKLPPDTAVLVERIIAIAERQLSEQANKIRELESLSVTDPLTGLLNRRGFEAAMVRTLAQAQRHEEEGVLAYIDLDGFKNINDSFGHTAGDDVLRHVAALLKRTVRSTDYVARLGGDEFAVIFTNTAPNALRAILGKLRRNLGGSLARIGDRLIEVRASIGTEAFGAQTSLDDLVSNADRAMYRAKSKRSARAA